MSTDQQIHLGPYVVTKKLVKEVEQSFSECQNEKCILFNKPLATKFCPQCGSEVQKGGEKVPIAFKAIDALNEGNFVDEFYYVQSCGREPLSLYCILVPNHFLPHRIEIKENEMGVYDLSGINQERDINELKERYNKALNFLEVSGFGIQYKWGLVISFF